jgi:hypothetical protein
VGIYTQLKNWIAPTPQQREHRQALRTLARHKAHLEQEYKRLSESIVVPWERFMDGDRLLYPAGFPQDRSYGRNRPTLENEQDLRMMRAYCRLLCETNIVCLGFRDHVCNFVVGKGFEWEVVARGQKKGATSQGMDTGDTDPDIEACQQVLDEFRRLNGWGSITEAVVSGDGVSDTSPMENLERETYERSMEDGEAFIRLFRGDSSTRGVPQMRHIEPECIRTPPGETLLSDWGWGIQTDPEDNQRRLAYYVVDPESESGDGGEVVPASRVLHYKLNTKSSVKRGIPDFWPLQDEACGVRTLVRNMIHVSGLLAAIAYIREHAPTTTSDQVHTMIDRGASGTATIFNRPGSLGSINTPGEDRTRTLNLHQAGLIIDVSNQLRYTAGPINTGIPGFVQAEQATLRMIGLRWGCPEYFSGDSSNANFASTLVSGGPFERSAEARQQNYAVFQGQLATRVLSLAAESGRLTHEQIRKVAVKVTAPPVAISNKSEDTNRRRTLFDAKVLSAQTWITEEGYDPALEAANIKAWAEQFPDDQGGGMAGIFGGGGPGDDDSAPEDEIG